MITITYDDKIRISLSPQIMSMPVEDILKLFVYLSSNKLPKAFFMAVAKNLPDNKIDQFIQEAGQLITENSALEEEETLTQFLETAKRASNG